MSELGEVHIMEKVKLFCFAYAGGSASFFKNWAGQAAAGIEIIPVELPGRGSRYGERLCRSLDELMDDVFRQVIKNMDGRSSEYVLFGHSMGTLVICELIQRLQQRTDIPEPLHVFFSGRYPPHNKPFNQLHNLPTDEFKRCIAELGGTPGELLDDREIFEIFEPILRADYQVLETYEYKQPEEKWNFSISVFYGSKDREIQEYDYSEWRHYTNESCTFYEFDGDHFFIHSHWVQMIDRMNQQISLHRVAAKK